MIAALTDLLDEIEGVAKFPESHHVLSNAGGEVMIRVYEDAAELDSEFASHIAENA